jgi:glycine oxidase
VTLITQLDVIVIGGGAIGAACARAAAARGLHVALFDHGPASGAASPASAGLLAAQIEPGDDAWLALAVTARDRYRSLAGPLRQTTGIDIGFRNTGIATLAFTQERAGILAREGTRQRAAGLKAEWLTLGDVRRRWPGIAPDCVGALFAPDDGSVDAPALTLALLGDATRLGVRTRSDRIERIEHANGVITGVVSSSGAVHARHVVVAAGAWSGTLAGLPRALPVSPVRGQLLSTPWPRRVPPAAFYHDHGYVLCRGSSAIMGSTMEHAGFESRITEPARAEIMEGARRLIPGLGDPERQWAGLRPMTPDGLPIIGADPDVEGLWYATGHGRNGILLAPLTGEIVADLITTGATSVEIESLKPARFDGAIVESPGPRSPVP